MSADTIILPRFEPLCFKRTDLHGVTVVDAGVSEKTDEKSSRKKAYICRFCRQVITFPEKIIQIDGSHLHIFTNPAGVIYEIGCFSTAEGCVVAGEPTKEFTWFRGFWWSYAICSGCLNHLGWFYRKKGGSGFFGLVTQYLAENL